MFIIKKKGSQCTVKGRGLPIPYKCHQYLLKLLVAGTITISTLTCLQSVNYSHKEECTKQTLTEALFSDYRSVIFFHKNKNHILKRYVTKIHSPQEKKSKRNENNVKYLHQMVLILLQTWC